MTAQFNTVEMNTTSAVERKLERKSTRQMNRFLLNTSFMEEEAEIADNCLLEQYRQHESELAEF